MREARGELMPIGKFAAMCRLSLRALRLYDEQDVLRPAVVDAESGYRYYRLDQSRDALLIRLLRQLGVPLSEIRRIVRAGSTGEATARLDEFWAGAEARLRQQQRTLAYLHRLMPTQHVLSRSARMSLDTLRRHIRSSKEMLRAHAERAGAPVAGAPIVILHGKVNEESSSDVEVCLPIAAPTTDADGIANAEVAGGPVAFTSMTYAQFEFPEILSAYEAVATWARQHGHELAGPPREVHLVNLSDWAGDQSETVAELHWPIR
jgi:DNA-binding transcriptional MerR regulator